ncbi:MAG TPA: glucose-6-phosphate isomerase [Bacteroidales bacterium]|nr:glucose-6-phosphate isomerase [Bacteroidales bacterium]
MNIKFDISGVGPFLDQHKNSDHAHLESVYQQLTQKKGKGNTFLGWLDLPDFHQTELVDQIKSTAKRLIEQSDIVVVVGIGGSYLGARAVIDAFQNPFQTLKEKSDFPTIVYAGQNLSESYHTQLLQLLDQKEYSIVVISKSGTTTEPAIAFRLLKDHCEKKYGQTESKQRIVVITDARKGALKLTAQENGYQSFVIPDDVGGRYSVLSPVGLLPIAIAGIDINDLLAGALEMKQFLFKNSQFDNNIALQYAYYRYLLYQNGKKIELLTTFEPSLFYFIEWFKQLFGESEGKEHKGIFPAGAIFSTDLHSLGQYIQEGERDLFETFISIQQSQHTLSVPRDEKDLDGLNYLIDKSIHQINQIAEKGTIMAHIDGSVPCFRIIINELTPKILGQLIYFFEFSCALGGYLLDINPFDQPGVEAYKKNMFTLLGKK